VFVSHPICSNRFSVFFPFLAWLYLIAQFEETVLITPTGSEALTRVPPTAAAAAAAAAPPAL
jgi:hypothetical protein